MLISCFQKIVRAGKAGKRQQQQWHTKVVKAKRAEKAIKSLTIVQPTLFLFPENSLLYLSYIPCVDGSRFATIF
jgi:hypothetical protein